MSFENDLFISYAHIDDQPLIEGQEGWITGLHRALGIRLGQLLGREPRIWRDPKLTGNDIFGDELLDRLPDVAALVSVLSPRYVRSEWCLREVGEFMRQAEEAGRLKAGNKLRVFKVVKTPVPLEQHPARLQDVLGYDFFEVDPDTGRGHELSQTRDGHIDRRYWAKLDDLAHDVCDLLQESEPAAGPAGEPAAAEGKGFVYLAETSFDLKEQREALRRDFHRQGYGVLPDRPLPLEADALAEAVDEQLERAALAVHLMGRSYGVVPDGADESLVVIQNRRAAERSRAAGLPRLIWLPPGLTARDERQQSFLEVVQRQREAQLGADLLQVPLEDLKSAAYDKLRPEEKPEEPSISEGDDFVRVYLICDQRDEDATAPLADHLYDTGFEVVLPAFEGAEAQVREDHEENLVLCDVVLLYYGAGNELWLRRQLREVQKSAGYGRQAPLLAKAVYVAPPASPRKARLRTREALVIHPPESWDSASLQPFLTEIEHTRARKAG